MAQNQVDGTVNSQTSTDRSSTRKRPNTDIHQVEDTTHHKKRKCSETEDSCTRIKVDSIDVLPLEIFHTILRTFATKDLLAYRQVCKKWNDVSAQILRHRADVEIQFAFEEGQFMRCVKFRHCNKLLVNLANVCETFSRCHYINNLKHLTDLVEDSQSFPFTKFRFDCAMIHFQYEDMLHFQSIWGEYVHALTVTVDNPNSVGVLKELLLLKFPNVKSLELEFRIEPHFATTLQLFVASTEFQLPKLEKLYLIGKYKKYRWIVEHILAAASNLKQFELVSDGTRNNLKNLKPEDLTMLRTFNKLNCLKNVHVHMFEQLIDHWAKWPKDSELKLQSLKLSLETSILQNEQLKNSATVIINRLLCSSKNTIRALSSEALGVLPALAIPCLQKLKKFELRYGRTMVPSFEMAVNFPNLNELDMHDLSEVLFQPQALKPIPSVEVQLMKATPNVKTLLLVDDEYPWSDQQDIFLNFSAINKYLPKVESLGIQICRSEYRDLMHSLDAEITGIPENTCRRMSTMFRHKDHLTKDELANYELRRRSRSIMDLKGINILKI